jgi:hypothetical protein
LGPYGQHPGHRKDIRECSPKPLQKSATIPCVAADDHQFNPRRNADGAISNVPKDDRSLDNRIKIAAIAMRELGGSQPV